MKENNRQNYAIIAAFLLAFMALFVSGIALNEAGQLPDIEAMGVHPAGTTNFGTLALSGDLSVAGDTLVGGSNYPLGYASTDKQMVCGTTGVFSDSVDVDLSGSLSAIDFAVMEQVTVPAATAALIYFTAPSTTTLTIKSVEADYTAGTTDVVIQYCVVGDQ